MSDQTRDEEEPQESTEETSADAGGDDEEASPAVAEAPKRAGGGQRTKGQQPPSEERLNAPAMQTVGMLGVVAAATLVMWAAGRAACNYHEPGESLSPRAVALQARTRTPKDVALELSQRWLTADFAVAEQLVSPAFLPTLQKDKASCTGASCEARKSAKALSTAEALTGNPVDTYVRVRTVGIPQGEVTKLYQVERIGSDWKVTRELDPSAPLPPLKEPPAGTMPQMGGPTLMQPGPGPVPPGQGPLLPGAAPTPPAAVSPAPQPAPAAPPPKAP